MSPHVEHGSIVGELKELRRSGLVRLRTLALPALRAAAEGLPDGSVEGLVRLAVGRLDPGSLRTAAEYTLGLAPGTRDWPAADRRKRSAEVYGVSVERFRKEHELMVLGQVAEEVGRVAQAAGRAPGGRPGRSAGPVSGHRAVTVRAGGRVAPLTVHAHPVDLLRDVDVVVSPVNTYLALPEPYKASVSASLRRAAAVRGVTGDVHDDALYEELRKWAARYDTSGRPVLPGTVATTGSGALAGQGIRRIYHAAIAVPRAGTNDYDVLPGDITRAAARVFGLLADEHARFDPPLRSVCFPLLGSGRGGLPYETSADALWAAIEAELARGAGWEVHLLVRHPEAVDALLHRLPVTGVRPEPDRTTTGLT
ncbi:hypothetical protein LG634_04655 [Streptomyces bambusae]|uniref:macro domain-containing protein n=1 Tax=Streptomyces bambusae TaxID=1550616 RepID=UPI001CFDF67B|nr:macro domain-containing protein [Streptomyces bambusae]MCB5164126.1 hypothetical protein [Streptomyces bambusae]